MSGGGRAAQLRQSRGRRDGRIRVVKAVPIGSGDRCEEALEEEV